MYRVPRLCGYAGFGRISEFLCGYFYYAVIRIISFLDLPLFAKIPLILPNLSHFSLTIGLTFVISLAIQSIRSICESLFITLIIFFKDFTNQRTAILLYQLHIPIILR